jgi:hypothetical protein
MDKKKILVLELKELENQLNKSNMEINYLFTQKHIDKRHEILTKKLNESGKYVDPKVGRYLNEAMTEYASYIINELNEEDSDIKRTENILNKNIKTKKVKCHCPCHTNKNVKHSHPCCLGGYIDVPESHCI